VEVVDANSYIFPTYPVSQSDGTYRSYLQAKQNARYSIRVRNYTGKRIGLVVAVDGRNIISGKKSYLRNTERMYILKPGGVGTYRGWRTGRDEIRRFYFTNEGGSYAGAWGDYSAMGVIAVVAYAEKEPIVVSRESLVVRESVRMAPMMEPGTGVGEREDSSSIRVDFTAKPYPLEKHLFKYEWRESLCEKKIISCNRLWDNDYVQPPPGERRW
jgi:hypothetical protein